jgi:hypothetical protein
LHDVMPDQPEEVRRAAIGPRRPGRRDPCRGGAVQGRSPQPGPARNAREPLPLIWLTIALVRMPLQGCAITRPRDSRTKCHVRDCLLQFGAAAADRRVQIKLSRGRAGRRGHCETVSRLRVRADVDSSVLRPGQFGGELSPIPLSAAGWRAPRARAARTHAAGPPRRCPARCRYS